MSPELLAAYLASDAFREGIAGYTTPAQAWAIYKAKPPRATLAEAIEDKRAYDNYVRGLKLWNRYRIWQRRAYSEERRREHARAGERGAKIKAKRRRTRAKYYCKCGARLSRPTAKMCRPCADEVRRQKGRVVS